MAGSVNKVILVGNLGADPEVRHTQDGRPVVNLRLATCGKLAGQKSGESKERTEWHRVVIFNENLAKVAEQYLKKGCQSLIEGQLQTRKYTDQQGQERYSTEVVLQQYRGRIDDARQPGSQRQGASDMDREISANRRRSPGSAPPAGIKPASFTRELDDEVPF